MEPVTEWIRHRFPTVGNVCPNQLEQLVKENRQQILMLDVRSPAEYEVSHLQGAIRVDPETTDMDHLVKDLGLAGSDAAQTVVCYCTVGFHASQLIEKLLLFLDGDRRLSFQRAMTVYNLEGGLLKWAEEKKPLVDGTNHITSQIHPYCHIWAQLLKADFKASRHQPSPTQPSQPSPTQPSPTQPSPSQPSPSQP
ncbi:probable adenylyltransferase/sulfurtransferase MoeZ [Stegostoma tigrinum]|uniref:probable adenylyltransferase/sulfurtransferase MoeZ n=1 Tax=Stegostoma tigrinum TaxID=3053191 RepID=UPI0028702341|nr:probable adenylyltransferase/sulfurtransferase MoeZ [Stegostoma tigrinum]